MIAARDSPASTPGFVKTKTVIHNPLLLDLSSSLESLQREPEEATNALKRRPCPLRLFLLDLGLARHRHDPKCGDAVALAAQHAEAEAVKGKTLAAFGDRAGLVDHEAGDGGRLFIRQMPVHGAVEIADRHRAVDHHR